MQVQLDAICPRISPAAFFAVCKFTYVAPPRIFLRTAAGAVAVPLCPDLQGPQRVTAGAGFALPASAEWMCAAPTTPVIPLKVMRHLIVRPLTVAVKVPEPRAPLGVGIDWFTVMNAVSLVVFAERPGDAGDATAVATATVAHIPTTTYITVFIFCVPLTRHAHQAPAAVDRWFADSAETVLSGRASASRGTSASTQLRSCSDRDPAAGLLLKPYADLVGRQLEGFADIVSDHHGKRFAEDALVTKAAQVQLQ